jgi:hypothetical protein
MQLKILLEGVAKDLPDFNEYKEFLTSAVKEAGKMPKDDIAGKLRFARGKIRDLENMLAKEHIKVDIDIEKGTRASFDISDGVIYIGPDLMQSLMIAITSGREKELVDPYKHFSGALAHELTHRNQAIRSKGRSIISVAKDLDLSKLKGNAKLLGQSLNDLTYQKDPQEIGAFAAQLAFQLKEKGLKTTKEVAEYIDTVIKKDSGSGSLVRDYKQFDYKNKDKMEKLKDLAYTPKETMLINKIKNIIKYDRVYKSFLKKVVQAFEDLQH